MLKRLIPGAILLGFLSRAAAAEFAEDIRARFTASGPTLALTYRVSYRVMGIELVHVADANVRVALGEWRGADGKTVPASAMDLAIDTLEDRETDRDRMIGVVLHNRVLAILRLPELEAIVFAKRTDQRLRYLWNRQRMNTTEVYDLEGGTLRYEGVDHLAGTTSTNLDGREELANEGKRVCSLLKAVHEAYVREEQRGPVAAEQNPVHLFIRGDLVPYGLRVTDRNARIRLFDRTLTSLRLWAHPLKRTAERACGCEAWVLPFPELAARVDPKIAEPFVGQIEEWMMVPLMADLDLPLGKIRGKLVRMEAAPPAAPAAAP